MRCENIGLTLRFGALVFYSRSTCADSQFIRKISPVLLSQAKILYERILIRGLIGGDVEVCHLRIKDPRSCIRLPCNLERESG